jgi:hypothetical protein
MPNITSEMAIQLMKEELLPLKLIKPRRIGKEINIRCPFCGDSIKNPKNEHLYIKIAIDDDDRGIARFPFDCKLCGKRGRSLSVLDARKIGITNPVLLEYISSLHQLFLNSVKKFNLRNKKIALQIPHVNNTQEKLQYIYNRLENDDICNHPETYKIILDLVGFFKENKLPLNTDYYNVKTKLRNYHEHAIGFLSSDNSHIIFRTFDDKLSGRYGNYAIYPENDTVKVSGHGYNTYTIPSSINIMNPTINLVMAEGIFDLLRVYKDIHLHQSTDDYKYTVFAAANNNHGYTNSIRRFLEQGAMFNNISIYSDIDININSYKNTIRRLIPDTNTNITIYYNSAYKDFGDVKQPLKIEKVII